MPHICLRCKTRLEPAPGLAPRCPSCGGTKFAFESARKEETGRSTVEPEPSTGVPEVQESGKVPATPTCDNKKPVPGDEEPLTTESVESIRII
ncbi:MAG: Zn-ribbon domain-containing protein, partial [Methanospirillum sp.]|uniref:OapC/ArvC family zinc-ribbon domain-containing protein n=1 Tax=Methanospirillum sp. TaxID=45200 RepID=UPI0023759CCC